MTQDSVNRPDDHELREWMDDWQDSSAGPVTPAALSAEQISGIRRRVRRFSGLLVLTTVLELLSMVAVLTWVIHDTLSKPSVPRWVGLGIVLLLVIAAEGFALWNRRGTWRPATDSTRAFVELTLLRCRRQLFALRFVYYLLALELLLLLPWRFWVLNSESDTPITLVDFFSRLVPLAIVIVGLLIGLAIWGRRVRRTLDEAARLKHSLDDSH